MTAGNTMQGSPPRVHGQGHSRSPNKGQILIIICSQVLNYSWETGHLFKHVAIDSH